MNEQVMAIVELLQRDHRYHLEAYQFVREGLAYAQKVMKMPASADADSENPKDHHLTGQQLCQAIKEYALEQYGFMAKTVLKIYLCSSGLGSRSSFPLLSRQIEISY